MITRLCRAKHFFKTFFKWSYKTFWAIGHLLSYNFNDFFFYFLPIKINWNKISEHNSYQRKQRTMKEPKNHNFKKNVWASKSLFTNKAGNYLLLYELENEHHRHVTWLPIFWILIDHTVFLTFMYYYLLKSTIFNNVKCFTQCALLSKLNLLLYLSVFRENLDDIDFHVQHTVQQFNWIHFRIKPLHMDI